MVFFTVLFAGGGVLVRSSARHDSSCIKASFSHTSHLVPVSLPARRARSTTESLSKDIQTVVIVNFPQDNRFVNAVQFLYSLAIMLSTPLQLFPAVRIMENAFFSHSGKYNAKIKWEKNLFRAAITTGCAVISAVGASDLDKFVSIVGCERFHLGKGLDALVQEKPWPASRFAFATQLYFTTKHVRTPGNSRLQISPCFFLASLPAFIAPYRLCRFFLEGSLRRSKD